MITDICTPSRNKFEFCAFIEIFICYDPGTPSENVSDSSFVTQFSRRRLPKCANRAILTKPGTDFM